MQLISLLHIVARSFAMSAKQLCPSSFLSLLRKCLGHSVALSLATGTRIKGCTLTSKMMSRPHLPLPLFLKQQWIFRLNEGNGVIISMFPLTTLQLSLRPIKNYISFYLEHNFTISCSHHIHTYCKCIVGQH